ncbi:MAG: hypothetical protein EOO90_27590 [Pedobacter sp.]|nr:MAG: hypothetical protein EOO90_27590 [Pedobacter sp.]
MEFGAAISEIGPCILPANTSMGTSFHGVNLNQYFTILYLLHFLSSLYLNTSGPPYSFAGETKDLDFRNTYDFTPVR